MFFKPKYKLRHQGDEVLRQQIDAVQLHLQQLKKIETQDIDGAFRLNDNIKCQQIKFDLLYNEARYRGTKAKVLKQGITYSD